MSSSLVEMIAAIAIAGLIFAGALLPVTDTVHRYQISEADLQRHTLQQLAALRLRQVAGTIWREDSPPENHDVLQRATPTRLGTSRWELRAAKNRLWQIPRGGKAVPLAEPVTQFNLRYLLDDGRWVKSPKRTQLDRVVAVRYEWLGGDENKPLRGLLVLGDKVFAGGKLSLPEAQAGRKPYRRSDYERTIAWEIKDWK